MSRLITHNGKYLLDTNIIIDLMNGVPEALSLIASAADTFLPSVSLGELYFGAVKSSQRQLNLARIETLVNSGISKGVLSVDDAVARKYGELKLQLKLKGLPIPENDLWIAATAIAHGLVLATRDHHFRPIQELQTIGYDAGG